MTMTTTESRRLEPTTLNGPSTLQVIQCLSQPTKVDVSDTLVALWAESTPQQAEDGYTTQARILAAILDRQVSPFTVIDAMDACFKIHALQTGACLIDLYGNVPNTDHERDRWLRHEQQNLTLAALALGGAA